MPLPQGHPADHAENQLPTLRKNTAEPAEKTLNINRHFERTLALMGVRQSNGRPCHPQTQGKIERYHRALKQWLSARPPASSIDELNEQLAEFRHVYNEERPHRALGRRTPGEAYRAKGKALPDPELAARTQAKLDEEQAAEPQPATPSESMRGKPVPKDERTEPTRVDVTIDPKAHKIDRRGCITQDNIVGRRRVFNVGRRNAGRMAELLIDHGQAVAADLETGEILADQTLDATREYQYRKPANDVNDAPRQM